MMQLLKLVLIAAINSPRRLEYIKQITTLSTPSQTSLKDLIEDVYMRSDIHKGLQTDDPQVQESAPMALESESPTAHGNSSSSFAADQELMIEQRAGKVVADNKELIMEKAGLQKDLRELDNRLVRLQENNVSLENLTLLPQANH